MAADSSVDARLGPAWRLTRGTRGALPIVIALIGMTLNPGWASANLAPLAGNPDQPHLGGSAQQIIMASAAPGAVSAIPRSRPSLPETAESAAPRPAAKPAAALRGGAAPQADSARAARTSIPHMPRPIPRPETLAERAAASQIQRATVSAPAGMGGPGTTRSALPGSTSLLGVLETSAGREALLRTSSGQVVKVTSGTMVEGWQVNAIERDAIRLTKGGETRTLRILSN